jgi:hypothetical protein
MAQSFFGTLRDIGARPGGFVASPAFRWLWLVYGGTHLPWSLNDSWDTLVSMSTVKAHSPGLLRWPSSDT